MNTEKEEEAVDSQSSAKLKTDLPEQLSPLHENKEEITQDSLGGDPLFAENIDLDFDIQLYPGTGIGSGLSGIDASTHDFALSAFGGSDYDDNSDMDQQTHEYWEGL